MRARPEVFSGTMHGEGKRLLICCIVWIALAFFDSTAFAQKPVMLDGLLLGYDLDMPDDPSVAEQVAAGNHQIEVLRQEDQTLDSQTDLVEYFNSIVAQLLKNHQPKPRFPIVVHVGTEPVVNAFAMPGGHIVVYSDIFDLTDDESGLVGILAHETSHQLHGDFLRLWQDYKTNRQIYGPGGVLEESRQFEQDADLGALRLMYDAGWDPRGQIAMMEQLRKRGVMARHGAPTTYATHPRDPARIEADKELIETFPPKTGLIRDSARYQELKQKY